MGHGAAAAKLGTVKRDGGQEYNLSGSRERIPEMQYTW